MGCRMAKGILKPEEKKRWHSYHIPGMGNLNRVKLDAIFISVANSREHEMEKFNVCYTLKQLGHRYITEAEKSIKGVKYRRDVVDLTTGTIFEIETDPKRAERFKDDPETEDIKVIALWEHGRDIKGD